MNEPTLPETTGEKKSPPCCMCGHPTNRGDRTKYCLPCKRRRDVEKCRRWRLENPEKARELTRRYFQRPNGKAAHRRSERKQKKVNRQKYIARKRLRYAVSVGNIPRSPTCERCGEERLTEAHHRDYSKPLEVEWTCRDCHEQEHYGKSMRRLAEASATIPSL